MKLFRFAVIALVLVPYAALAQSPSPAGDATKAEPSAQLNVVHRPATPEAERAGAKTAEVPLPTIMRLQPVSNAGVSSSAASKRIVVNTVGTAAGDVTAGTFGANQGTSTGTYIFLGNVGIGTTAPTTKLTIQPLAYTSATDGIKFLSSDSLVHCLIQPIKLTSGAMNLFLGSNSYVSTVGQVNRFGAGTPSAYINVRSDDGTIRFATSTSGADPTEKMYINSSGNVGIGNTNPAYPLDVTGNIHATGTVSAGSITASGSITGATVIGAVYQDVAEWVPASSNMLPGTVVVLNRDRNNEVMPSARAYDTAVAGVVSAHPGVLLGVAAASKAQIATTGRVRVKVDATRQPIQVGDLLVTSDRSGLAMKSIPVDLGGVPIHRPGTLIGKALEPLPSGEGEILVLLSLQ